MPKIRVVIADDHRLVREGIQALLAASDAVEVVGEASNGREAIELCQRVQPDVLLMDIAMPGLGGLEATLELKRERPSLRIIILTQYDDREYVRRFLKEGVSGFVLKRTAGRALVDAIVAVHGGGLVLDPEIARDALAADEQAPTGASPYETLTDREKQVFKLVAEGMSNKEVAEALGITVKTAMTHRERVMGKLGLHNRTELVRLAIRLGVIRVDT